MLRPVSYRELSSFCSQVRSGQVRSECLMCTFRAAARLHSDNEQSGYNLITTHKGNCMICMNFIIMGLKDHKPC